MITTGIILDGEYEDEEIGDISREIFQKLQPVLNEIIKDIKAQNTQNISYLELDSETENCFQCNNCKKWTTHGERSNYIHGLPIGYTFENKDYCEQCLCWRNDPEYGWESK